MIEIKKRYKIKENLGMGLSNIKNTLNIYNTVVTEQKIHKNLKKTSD